MRKKIYKSKIKSGYKFMVNNQSNIKLMVSEWMSNQQIIIEIIGKLLHPHYISPTLNTNYFS